MIYQNTSDKPKTYQPSPENMKENLQTNRGKETTPRGFRVGIFSLPSCGWLDWSFDLQLSWSESSRKFSGANKQYIPHFLHLHLFIIFISQWIIESDILITREASHTDERNAVRGDFCALFKTFNIWINPLSFFFVCLLTSSKCCFSSSNKSFPKTKGNRKVKYLPVKL